MAQPLTDGPRAGYTAAQVTYLLQNTSAIDTDMGLELLTGLDLNVAETIDAVTGITVTRNSFATLHASATMAIDRELDWGNSLVRPYMTITGPVSSTATTLTTMKFYQGVYYVDGPTEDMSQVPSSWDVTGYDVLSVLDDPIGDAYSVDQGEVVLDRVELILLGQGITQYVIDRDQAGVTLSSPLVYTLDDNPTWLRVINDLLAAVGYEGAWSDWNGRIRCQEYTSPANRSPEWVFTADVSNTLLAQNRSRSRDLYNAYNRWVFYRSNDTDGPPPVEGDGLYTYQNDTVGDTSVEARGGRTKTRDPEGVPVSDQASLVAYAQRVIDADMIVPVKVAQETAPFPLAWHMDRYQVKDPALGAQLEVVASSWSLNLDGSNMTHEWTAL